jgi:hypothetical protein
VSTVFGLKSRRLAAKNEERDRKHTAASITDSNTSADIYDTTMGGHIAYADLTRGSTQKLLTSVPFQKFQ